MLAGENAEACACMSDPRAERRRDAQQVGEDAGITHRCYLSLALWQLGYPEQALRANYGMRKLARSIKHPFSLAYAQHHTSWLYHQLGLPVETKAASEEGIQTATEQGFAMFHATGNLYKAAGILLDRLFDDVAALAGPVLGHLDPEFLRLLDGIPAWDQQRIMRDQGFRAGGQNIHYLEKRLGL